MKKRISFIICMIISVSIFISACGIYPSSTKKDYPDPQETIDKLLTALSEGDEEAVDGITGDENDYDLSGYDELNKEFILSYYDLMKIEVNGEPAYKGKKVDLSLTVTSPDLAAVAMAFLDRENNEYLVHMVKNVLLATINGEDTTSLLEEMKGGYLEEMKVQMADPENQITWESSMKMILNEDEDGWIIEEMTDAFIDPEIVDMDSFEMSLVLENAVNAAFPVALDLLLEEGSIDQATYDAIKATR